MQAKALEIRDRMTFIAILAVEMIPTEFEHTHWGLPGSQDDPTALEEAQRYLLRRCGYPIDGRPMILLTRLDGDARHATTDPYVWGDRTFKTAHRYITENWATLVDGDVIDVEFILGETAQAKRSERETVPL